MMSNCCMTSEIWQSLDSSIAFNCWVKTGLNYDHVSKAENDGMQTMCDPQTVEIMVFLKRSLLIQHHFELDKLLQPNDY